MYQLVGPGSVVKNECHNICNSFGNFVHRDNTKCVRLPDAASIFRAELYALLLAIDVIQCSKEKNFVIFSDSMSSLQSINGFNLESDLVQKFLKDYTVLPCPDA